MDIIVVRSIFTVVCLCFFLGVIAWAYKRSNQAQFEEAARLPLAEDGSEALE